MIQWKQIGTMRPVFASDCGRFTVEPRYGSHSWPTGYIATEFDDEFVPAAESQLLPTVEQAKQWCESRELLPVLTL